GNDVVRVGFRTSLMDLNAVLGREYFVAVVGFVRSSGIIVLNWNLVATNVELPVIVRQPVGQTVALGGAASFSILATSSAQPLTYQWMVDGAAIVGATSETLNLPDVQVANVG